MIDGKTIVKVMGQPNVCENVWDFVELSTLEDSYKLALSKYKQLTEDEKDYYCVKVCYGLGVVYELFHNKISISEEYKGVINLKEGKI